VRIDSFNPLAQRNDAIAFAAVLVAVIAEGTAP
jgi:hypothetical protein